MRIFLDRESVKAMDKKNCKKLGISQESLGYHGVNVTLLNYSNDELQLLSDTLKEVSLPGVRSANALVKKFIEIRNGRSPRATSAKQMEVLLKSYLAKESAPRYRLVKKIGSLTYAYILDRIWYSPAEKARDGSYTPARVHMQLNYMAFGKREKQCICWYNSSCKTKPELLLAESGWTVETDEQYAEYLQAKEKYEDLAVQIGLQCATRGLGWQCKWRDRNDLNNATPTSGDSFDLGVSGTSNVVVDLVDDNESSSRNKSLYIDDARADVGEWKRLTRSLASGSTIAVPNVVGDEDEYDDYWDELEEEDAAEEGREIEAIHIPLWPMMPVFDLNRHDWFTVDVRELEVYEYKKDIYEKLVLSQETKDLVATLASAVDDYEDIISGKSGGMNVLLAGPPGVGKTLTAEVYAEHTERPLYRVQCSQLGIQADEIEEQLLQVFQRASRWNAITLLDESDVYIRKRGSDLTANAIVGVFLRVLEYQNSVLFMTTNLPESVDDAIASRCIARIDYRTPSTEDLQQIWRVLSNTAGMDISEEDIVSASAEFPYMAGRDVKNTLKLMLSGKPEQFDIEAIRRAARFHPNRGNWTLTSGSVGKWKIVGNPLIPVITNGALEIDCTGADQDQLNNAVGWLNVIHGTAV